MNFNPAPANDFADFFDTYLERCQARVPKIAALAGKWTFADLIPGLSDFDSRFITQNNMRLADWQAMSLAVGEVHTEMAVEFPNWARNLEHLPGVNLTVAELLDPNSHYPEFKQWTFYRGDSELLEEIADGLSTIEWTEREELFHLRKVATYFGRYQRGIDPGANMGLWENKYPLHSRYMHYFTPAVQAGVSLLLKRSIAGKFDALRFARAHFPNPATIDRVFAAVEAHYELPGDYQDPRLARIEDELEQYLCDMWRTLIPQIRLIQAEEDDSRVDIARKVNALRTDPISSFLDGTRFSRLMKGRLLFYSTQVAGFDSEWLIENELGRIVQNFHDKPLRAFGQVYFGDNLSPETVRSRLTGSLLPVDVVEEVNTFVEIASQPLKAGGERGQAAAVAECYDAVLEMLELMRDAIAHEAAGVA